MIPNITQGDRVSGQMIYLAGPGRVDRAAPVNDLGLAARKSLSEGPIRSEAAFASLAGAIPFPLHLDIPSA